MTLDDFPLWAAWTVSAMLVMGATLTFIGVVGLATLRNFYQRVHAPTLGATLGAGFVLVASMIFFSVLEDRLVLREAVIAVFLTVTTPVTLILLARAALYRDRAEGRTDVPADE